MDAPSRLDLVAKTLVDRASPVVIRVASTRSDVAAAQRLRGRAILERGWATADELVDHREVADGDDRATHLLAFLNDTPIGTCRLIYSDGSRPLPMEDIEWLAPIPRPVVELGRVVVTAGLGLSQHSVTAALVGRSWLEIRAHGYQRICGTVSAAMLRLYRRLGFLIEVIGPPAMLFGEERFPILFEPNAEAAAAVAARHS